MKRILCILTALTLLCGLTACKKEELQSFEAYSFDYFDTATTIVGYAKNQETFDKVANEALERLGEYHRLYDIYTPRSDTTLYTINRSVGNAERTFTVDQKIIDLLLYAREMHDKTDGMVNVAMGSVLSLWHDYRTAGMDDPADAALPPMEKLTEAAKHTDITNMVIDEAASTVTLTDPQMTLDVGAIAKGYATEQVARWMESQGVSGYILNVGGNIRTIGQKGDGQPWVAGLQDPQNPEGAYLAYLQLRGEALVTSGSYQRYYLVAGKRYHHIIHPDTLMPAEEFLSVSILCADSGMADALSTALFCMPLEEGKALAASLEGVEVLWIAADGTRTATDGWNKYVKQ